MFGGIDPHSLTLWEWQAMAWGWNDRHSPPTPANDKPDPEMVRRSLALPPRP